MSAFAQNRDPKEVRTRWILERLKKSKADSNTLARESQSNEFGFAPNTYQRDLTALTRSRLVIKDSFGDFHIQPLGLQWLYARQPKSESREPVMDGQTNNE